MSELDGVEHSHKKNNLLLYGGIAAGGVVILLAIMRKGPTATTTGGTDGGANTSQPIIIPAGGGSTGPDATTTAALTQLAANQQTLADGISAGFAAEANKTPDTSIADGISAGFANMAALIASQKPQATSIPAGSTSTVPTAPAAGVTYTVSPVKTIFGATSDIAAAQSVYGTGSNYHYVDTSTMTSAQTRSALHAAGSNGLIVGGYAAGGGVDQNEAAGLGITRLAGNDVAGTLAAIKNYSF